MAPRLELIAFKTCPFAQRISILLHEKGTPFTHTYIERENRPQWFWDLSPTGKVPLLKVEGTVLWESLIIADYIDEAYPPLLRPSDPLTAAKSRLNAALASELFSALYKLTTTQDQKTFKESGDRLQAGLKTLQDRLDSRGPFFDGALCRLADLLMAPLWTRLLLLERQSLLEPWPQGGRLRDLALLLQERPSVRDSVVKDFEEVFMEEVRKGSPLLLQKS